MGFSLKNNALTNYFRESSEELKKVTWPTRKTVLRDTLIVIGISVAVGLFFGGLDFVLNIGLEKLIEIR